MFLAADVMLDAVLSCQSVFHLLTTEEQPSKGSYFGEIRGEEKVVIPIYYHLPDQNSQEP